jgi:hypothetical protein
MAQSIRWRKKHSSQLALALPLRPLAMLTSNPFVAFASPTVHTSKRIPFPLRKLDFRKTQQLRNILKYLETAGFCRVPGGTARIFRSFVRVVVQAQ